MRIAGFLFLMILSLQTFAKVEFTATCKLAYEQMIHLETAKASLILAKERKENPSNIVPDFIENYSFFLRVLLNEEKDNYDSFIDKAEVLIDKFNEESDKFPYKKYCITDIYLQLAYINTIQESNISAALKLRKARSYILENEESFPDFLPNKKALGMMNVALGSVPESYGWIMDLFGMEGSVNQGLKMLKELSLIASKSNAYSWLATEAILGYAFSATNFGDLKSNDVFLDNYFKAIEKDSSLFRNQILCYSASSYYRHIGKNESVIRVLSHRKVSSSLHMAYLDYMLGMAYLYKIENQSIKWLNKYIKDYKGQNYRKSALQKIGWYYLVLGNNTKYSQYMKRVKEEGVSFYDSDKQAMKAAESGEVPNRYLLKLRLLFDGGYYKEARRVFELNQPISVLKTRKDFLEYNYRLGRLYDEWGKTSAAIGYYEQALDSGKDYPYYYAANSALHLGYIYESKKDYKKAEAYYKICLSLDFNEYHNSITQKAKAGLNRVEKQI